MVHVKGTVSRELGWTAYIKAFLTMSLHVAKEAEVGIHVCVLACMYSVTIVGHR